MPPRYYAKDTEALYRRRDGAALLDAPPDEVLWPNGSWQPLAASAATSAGTSPRPSERGGPDGGADPELLRRLVEIDESRARDFARALGLPADWR